MPGFDSKRINGPSVTQSLSKFLPRVANEDIVDATGARKDGRSATEIRSMYMKAGCVYPANGSAYIETSGSKLICAVYGPRDNPKRHEFSSKGTLTCEVKFAPFSRRERVLSHQEATSKEYASAIIQALQCAVCLETYPKAQIDIYVTVLEDNGNTLSQAVIAACAALNDAGIEMLDVVTSCSLSFLDERTFIDPTAAELKQSDGYLILSYMPSLNQISFILQHGEQSVSNSVTRVNACIEACLRVHAVVKDCLINAASTDEEDSLI